MREMVFRERMERVAHVRVIAAIIGRVMGSDADRAFGDLIAEYASEVFQESYDPTVLMRKRDRLRENQARVRQRKLEDLRAIERLQRIEKLGDAYDENVKKVAAAKRSK